MKHTKKWLSVLLVLVMALSLTESFTTRAATSITVTIRVEQDVSTALAPVSVTLTDADKKDFGIGLSTDALTPLHALAKYLSEIHNVSDQEMGKYIIASPSAYGLYVSGISISGDGVGSAAAHSASNIYWNYRINDAYVDVGMDVYTLKDKDSIVFYGLWSPYPAEDEVLYASFDKPEYSTALSTPVTVTLTGSGTNYDENFNAVPYTKPIAGATVMAFLTGTPSPDAATQDIYWTSQTDAQGRANFTFHTAGTYILSAYRQAADGEHFDISKPYAEITVTDHVTPSASASPGVSSAASPTISPTGTPPVITSAPGSQSGEAWKIYAPTKVKATVKKSKARKKKITVSWMKSKCSGNIQNVSGYEIVLSKKKKTGYKKITQTKKTKFSFKRGKGIYYVKIRAYKADKGRHYSSYTAPIKIKVSMV